MNRFQALLLFIVFLAGQIARAQNAYAPQPKGEPGIALFEQIVSLKKSSGVNRADEFLAQIPADLLGRQVLIFKSFSLQEADMRNPRVLLFSKDADFVLSFNGDPSQYGFEGVETMRFSYAEDRFIFEEIPFEGDVADRKLFLARSLTKKDADRQIGLLDNRASRTGPNAVACIGCHRGDARPNWDHYPFWPGVFGQLDSKPLQEKGRFLDPASGAKSVVDNRAAAAALLEFVKTAPTHRRYKWLRNLDQQLPANASDGKIPFGPASALTEKLAALNFRRVFRLTQPVHQRAKWVALAGEQGCIDLPKELQLSYFGRQDLTESGRKLLYGLAKVTGLPSSLLTTNFQRGPGNSFATPGSEVQTYLALVASRDPEIASHSAPVTAGITGSPYGAEAHYAPRARSLRLLSCASIKARAGL